jgi:hypothetical protein
LNLKFPFQVDLLVTLLIFHIGKNELEHLFRSFHAFNTIAVRDRAWRMKWIIKILDRVVESSVDMYRASFFNSDRMFESIIILPAKIPFIDTDKWNSIAVGF